MGPRINGFSFQVWLFNFEAQKLLKRVVHWIQLSIHQWSREWPAQFYNSTLELSLKPAFLKNVIAAESEKKFGTKKVEGHSIFPFWELFFSSGKKRSFHSGEQSSLKLTTHFEKAEGKNEGGKSHADEALFKGAIPLAFLSLSLIPRENRRTFFSQSHIANRFFFSLAIWGENRPKLSILAWPWPLGP